MKTLEKILICLIIFLLGALFSEYRNRDLQKYVPLQKTIEKISQTEYNIDSYNCLDFSKDGQALLYSEGMGSSIIIGQKEGAENPHAFLGVWIEPQTGELISNYDFERVYDK